jgi:hypothetical protein
MWTKVAEQFLVRHVEEGNAKAFGQVPLGL